MTPHIQLSTGEFFNFLEPDPALITIPMLAKALSQLCRFTGHTSEFYSVAQHSVLVSRLVPPELARWGLFHDAAEALIGDVSSPLKQLLPEYKTIERRVERCVWEALGLYGPMPPEVKLADMSAILAERERLMPQGEAAVLGWQDHINRPDVQKCPFVISPIAARMAEGEFIARARYLGLVRIAA
jgi:uncharacterized protein